MSLLGVGGLFALMRAFGVADPTGHVIEVIERLAQ